MEGCPRQPGFSKATDFKQRSRKARDCKKFCGVNAAGAGLKTSHGTLTQTVFQLKLLRTKKFVELTHG